jgi:hypothetical protein
MRSRAPARQRGPAISMTTPMAIRSKGQNRRMNSGSIRPVLEHPDHADGDQGKRENAHGSLQK